MEAWFIILVSISVAALLKSSFNLLFPSKKPSYSLPPGPFTFPIIGSFLLLLRPSSELEAKLKLLHAKLGPMVTLSIGLRRIIFVADRSLAHQALVQNGSVFANRPEPLLTDKIFSSNQHNISSGSYGPTWRLFRRNLAAEILHPSRVKSYSNARKWALKMVLDRFKSTSESGAPIRVLEDFQYAMFCLLVFMCFGDKIDETQVKKIENMLRERLLNIRRFSVLNFWPSVSKIVFYKRWKELRHLVQRQHEIFIPLIRARKSMNAETDEKAEHVLAYVDTLFNLQLPEEKRNLTEEEMISLCTEFLIGGTDTTSTALQWVMANLVKYQHIQEKLYAEIKSVVEDAADHVKEDELQKMPYLKSVILEALRRHPPAHFVAPHTVTEDVMLAGCLLPKNSILNFLVAEMGWDSKAWEDPMAFKPERFLSSIENGREAFDITGSREIKMMPFGVGRRICPGLNLALLHLQYFTANLVWAFKWSAVDGDAVDLTEKQQFLMVMKYPLKANISPRTV